MNKHKFGFSTLIGQTQLKTQALKDLQRGELAHAVLFTGAEGSGRHSLAKAVAKYLLCQDPQADDACHLCSSCIYFEALTHPDFICPTVEEKKDIKVERIRKEVIADLNHRPQIAESKVYLIDGDYLNESGQNALLKSLEEPPAYAYFLITVKDAEHLLPTVVSRSAEFSLAPLTAAEIKTLVSERGGEIAPKALSFLAAYAKGNPGRALNLVEREGFNDLRDEVVQYFVALPRKTYLDILYEDQNFLLQEKDKIEEIWEITQSLLRDVVLLFCGAEDKILNQDKITELRHLGNQIWQNYQFAGVERSEIINLLAQNFQSCEAKQSKLREALQSNANFEILTWTYLQNLKAAVSPKI